MLQVQHTEDTLLNSIVGHDAAERCCVGRVYAVEIKNVSPESPYTVDRHAQIDGGFAHTFGNRVHHAGFEQDGPLQGARRPVARDRNRIPYRIFDQWVEQKLVGETANLFLAELAFHQVSARRAEQVRRCGAMRQKQKLTPHPSELRVLLLWNKLTLLTSHTTSW